MTRESETIDLQAKEFSLLEYFMRNPERVLSKTLILEQVYGYNFDTQTNVIDVLVHRLRSKVDKDFEEKTPTGKWEFDHSLLNGWYYEFDGTDKGQKMDYLLDAKTGKFISEKVDD